MKFEIKHRWSGEILFSIETESWKLAVEAAIKAKANLSEADLSKADLSKANLSYANLSWADLSEADLSWADLSWADLSWADLSKADLSYADLSEANLSWADPCSLRHIKHDIWGILLHAQAEVPELRKAVVEGRINGSVYSGECACLCGTIANVRKCDVTQLEGIQMDTSSMAERWFMGIKKGDTPENNSASKLVLQWIDEFTAITQATPKA